jgi:hypothetical protein
MMANSFDSAIWNCWCWIISSRRYSMRNCLRRFPSRRIRRRFDANREKHWTRQISLDRQHNIFIQSRPTSSHARTYPQTASVENPGSASERLLYPPPKTFVQKFAHSA